MEGRRIENLLINRLSRSSEPVISPASADIGSRASKPTRNEWLHIEMGGKERLGRVEKSVYSEVGWVTGRLGGVKSISLPVGGPS